MTTGLETGEGRKLASELHVDDVQNERSGFLSRQTSPAASETCLQPEQADEQPRFGIVAIAGAPNAGKSTLTNCLVGSKVSIVSPRVQTTRARISGIYCDGSTQVMLLDTPGIFARQKQKRQLERAMVQDAWSGIGEADHCVLLVDASVREPGEGIKVMMEHSNLLKKGLTLVLNKVDLVRPEKLLGLTRELTDFYAFETVFMISALSGDGVPALKKHINSVAQPGMWHFPEDQLSELPERLFAAEIVREKLFLNLHQELPYNLTVETESYKRTGKGLRIEQVIYTARRQHKAMILGKNGQKIKQIGIAARKELKQIYNEDVHLVLFVKVREDWLSDARHYHQMGLKL